MAKRKQDDGVGLYGRKKSKALMSLCALRKQDDGVAPLLSVGVATASALVVSPPLSSALSVPPFAILVMASPSSSSCPRVSLDHLYTSSDADSLWGTSYRLE